MGSDGAGKVVASAKGESDDLIGKRVFLNPSRGWLVILILIIILIITHF